MRYAIISDLHANILAFCAVLATMDRERVDDVICLGDIVGYNSSPNECVRLVRQLGIRSIAGNHDRAAVGTKDPRQFGRTARRVIDWTRPRLTRENADFLRRLPGTLLVDRRFFGVHGALHPGPNDDLHLSNPRRVEASMHLLRSGRFGSKLCFFGHTHHPVAYEDRSDGIQRIDPPRVKLVPGVCYLINPGSVGNPRDGDARASYAIFDTATESVEWRRVSYDVDAVARANRSAGITSEPFAGRIRAVLAALRS